MALNKTDKYGVPINDTADERMGTRRMGIQQPKFTSRFRVQLRDFGTSPRQQQPSGDQGRFQEARKVDEANNLTSNSVITSMVESFNKPTINFGSNEVTSFIGRAKYSGRPKMESFTMVFRDEITNTVISRIYNQIKMQTYKFNPVTHGGGLAKSIMLGFDTKFDCMVETMDGRNDHTPLETWAFYGCFIENVESTGLSYEDDASIVKITLQCQFDYFEIYQNQRVMFPQSYDYLDSKVPKSPPAGDENDGEGFFDAVSGVAGGVADGASSLFGKAKENFNGFINSDEDTDTPDAWDTSKPRGIGL